MTTYPFVGPIEVPTPSEESHPTTKAYVDAALATKAGTPFRGVVPAGSVAPTIAHGLGTTDVDVTVYRVVDGMQVGVPADRLDTNNVQLTFSTAPTTDEYRIVVSAGTGTGGGGGGGGSGPHAATHASGGSDPVTPASIGAATADHTHSGGSSGHDHAGVYADVVHNHSGLVPNGGIAGQVLTKDSDEHYDFSWQDGGGGGGSALKPYPPVELTPYLREGSSSSYNVDTNAALGNHFRVTIPADSYVYPTRPTNGVPGQVIMYEVTCHWAEGTTSSFGNFTLLNNSSGGHDFQWDFGDVQQMAVWGQRVDYVVVIYDERGRAGAGAWRMLSWTKNFPIIGSELLP